MWKHDHDGEFCFLFKKQTYKTTRFTRGENWCERAACTHVLWCHVRSWCRRCYLPNGMCDSHRQKPGAATWRWLVIFAYLPRSPTLTFRIRVRLCTKQTRPLQVTPLQVGVTMLTHCMFYFSHLDFYLLRICVRRWGSADTISWSEPDNWQKLLWEPAAARGVNVRISMCPNHTIEMFAAFILGFCWTSPFCLNPLVPSWFDQRVACKWNISCKVLSLVMFGCQYLQTCLKELLFETLLRLEVKLFFSSFI